jgi:hypothetical protein
MNESEVLRLINLKIDNEISRSEQETLDQILKADDQLRIKYEHMQATADGIKNLTEIDPPSSLKSDIIAGIDTQRYKKPESIWNKMVVAIEAAVDTLLPRRQVAFAFVTGLILGVCIFALVSIDEPVPNADVTGSIGLASEKDTQYFVMQSENIHAEFNIKEIPAGILCLAQIHTEHPFELQLLFDSPDHAVTEFVSLSGAAAYVQSSAGRILINADSGSHVKIKIKGPGKLSEQLSINIASQEEFLKKIILF